MTAGPELGAIHVRIVMATRDGAAFLPEQLASIAAQDHADWSLSVGDDGSRDGTGGILRAFAAAHPQRDITLAPGPGKGSAANFLNRTAAACRPGDWLAFADQDDVWMPHKLARALDLMRRQMAGAGAEAVLAYSSRSWLTDAALTPFALSPLHRAPPGFGNALVQNVLSGHAIVLSPAAAALVARTAPQAVQALVPFHDWWIYQLVTGAGGRVILDPEPGLYYRQHGANEMGHHRGLRARLSRLALLAGGEYAGWIDRNLEALDLCAPVLTEQARALAGAFADMRTAPRARDRLRALARLEIYRQTARGNLVLRLLAGAGRL